MFGYPSAEMTVFFSNVQGLALGTLKFQYSEGAQEFKKVLLKSIPRGFKARIIFTTNKASRYFTNKSKTPLGIKANLIYQFTCHKCQALYIGETNRHLRTRVAEHS